MVKSYEPSAVYRPSSDVYYRPRRRMLRHGAVVTPPLAAGTLTLVAASPFVVQLALATNSGGIPPYSNQLQRSLAGEDDWSNIGSPIVGATAEFTDSSGLLANTAYDYRVLVTDDAANVAFSNTVEVTTDVVPATYVYRLEGPAAAPYDLPGVPAITE